MTTIPESNGKIALVTGINGYIALWVGLSLLQRGYTLRGTLRRKSSADAILSGPYREYHAAGRVEIVGVPDIVVPGAFDEAVKGVHTILHTASPISFGLATLAEFVGPAVKGTETILESTIQFAGPQLESYVQTSSVAAVVTPGENRAFTAADWNVQIEQLAEKLGEETPMFARYQVSKVKSERAIWRFRDERKPPFTISAVNPAIVTGPPLNPPPMADGLNETLKPVWTLFSGGDIMAPLGSSGYIDVRDVGRVHAWVAEHKVDGKRFLMAAGRGIPQANVDILRRKYPERRHIIQEGKPGEGYDTEGYGWPEGMARFVCDEAREILGGKFIGLEESIVDTAKVLERYL